MESIFALFMEDAEEEVVFLPDSRPEEKTETEKALADIEKARKAETEEEKAAKAAKRAARIERNAGRVAAYDFTDTTIAGKGWYILFDGSEQKTRVIFEKKPSEKVRDILKDAGFFWNQPMQSWNRRLNMKTYKAAKELAVKLAAYTA